MPITARRESMMTGEIFFVRTRSKRIKNVEMYAREVKRMRPGNPATLKINEKITSESHSVGVQGICDIVNVKGSKRGMDREERI